MTNIEGTLTDKAGSKVRGQCKKQVKIVTTIKSGPVILIHIANSRTNAEKKKRRNKRDKKRKERKKEKREDKEVEL